MESGATKKFLILNIYRFITVIATANDVSVVFSRLRDFQVYSNKQCYLLDFHECESVTSEGLARAKWRSNACRATVFRQMANL